MTTALPPTARPPPLVAAPSPPAGTALVTETASRIEARRGIRVRLQARVDPAA